MQNKNTMYKSQRPKASLHGNDVVRKYNLIPFDKICPTLKGLFIAILVIGLASCQTKERDNYTIRGTILNFTDGIVYLQDRIAGQMIPVDTAYITNGEFLFEGQLTYPEIFYLRIEGVRASFPLFVENFDITLSIDPENPTAYVVQGSVSHDIFAGVDTIVAPHDERLRSLREEISAAEKIGDTLLVSQLRATSDTITQLRRQQVKDYVAQFPTQHAAVFVAMRQLAHGLEANELAEVVSLFDTLLVGARYYDDLRGRISILERVAIGQPAIEFSLPDTAGNSVSLSDFRGRYVYLKFWASWCPFCRVENPKLVEIYDRFKSSEFEMLGVSLDFEREAWLRGINDDGLLWPQVSELKGWRSIPAGDYGIRSIPQNLLIDTSGVIIGRNLSNKELEEKLKLLL